MSILYLTEQGSKVHKVGNRIVVRKEDNTLIDISLFKVDTIVVLGNVHFSTDALGNILSKNIDIAFLTLFGRLKGRIESYKSKNVIVKISQYEKHKNKEEKLKLAKIFLKAKIHNSLKLLKDYDKRDKELNLKEDIEEIEKKAYNIDKKDSIDGLMGVEGYTSRVYFTGFKKIVNKEKVLMETREPRGSKSFVNQLLSLGYVSFMNEIMSFIGAIGLDPYIGFLHSLDYGRPSLALDILEEYRSAVIDKFTLKLINKKIIGNNDFETKEEGLRLKQDKIKEYFKNYEKWVTENNREYKGVKTNFRNILKEQMRDLLKFFKGEEKEYIPFMEK